MTFQFAGQTYRIRFQHVHRYDESMPRRVVPIKRGWGNVKPRYVRAETLCLIERKEPGQLPERPVVQGMAYCSLSDSFNRETGRKLSLTRALHLFPPEFRTAAWRAYLERAVSNV